MLDHLGEGAAGSGRCSCARTHIYAHMRQQRARSPAPTHSTPVCDRAFVACACVLACMCGGVSPPPAAPGCGTISAAASHRDTEPSASPPAMSPCCVRAVVVVVVVGLVLVLVVLVVLLVVVHPTGARSRQRDHRRSVHCCVRRCWWWCWFDARRVGPSIHDRWGQMKITHPYPFNGWCTNRHALPPCTHACRVLTESGVLGIRGPHAMLSNLSGAGAEPRRGRPSPGAEKSRPNSCAVWCARVAWCGVRGAAWCARVHRASCCAVWCARVAWCARVHRAAPCSAMQPPSMQSAHGRRMAPHGSVSMRTSTMISHGRKTCAYGHACLRASACCSLLP
jgi:hypothetical protein